MSNPMYQFDGQTISTNNMSNPVLEESVYCEPIIPYATSEDSEKESSDLEDSCNRRFRMRPRDLARQSIPLPPQPSSASSTLGGRSMISLLSKSSSTDIHRSTPPPPYYPSRFWDSKKDFNKIVIPDIGASNYSLKSSNQSLKIKIEPSYKNDNFLENSYVPSYITPLSDEEISESLKESGNKNDEESSYLLPKPEEIEMKTISLTEESKEEEEAVNDKLIDDSV
ncbi:hypothetical protein HELRODRAFT_180790 [Helobdella robusta]|uniref:Uncharacterized protein n=1 Tax=Helobdella robusta TaxID=6412 RepID=T1FGA1_HELRO|nr:hypothetical protein HELRODRAFT_180790 [Helobdella robusta]ESN93693.1 hypothetical protein HELRODRAFT_180790 [Helobdella robusta]